MRNLTGINLSTDKASFTFPPIKSSLDGNGQLPGGLLAVSQFGDAADVSSDTYPTNPAPDLNSYVVLFWGSSLNPPYSPSTHNYGYGANITAGLSNAWNLNGVTSFTTFAGNVVTKAFLIYSHTSNYSGGDDESGADCKMKLIAPCQGLITRHTGIALQSPSGYLIVPAPDSSSVVNLTSGTQEIYHGPGGSGKANAQVSIFWPGLQSTAGLPAFPFVYDGLDLGSGYVAFANGI